MATGWLVSANTLTVIYLLLLGGGLVAAVALAFFGEAGEPLALVPLGPATLIAAVTCFGGAGVLALRLFGLPAGLSLLAAVVFALLSAALFFGLARAARRTQEQHAALADLVGALARVVTPIEPGGVGTIATNGARASLTLPATSRHARVLAAGTVVIVTALQGDRAEVAPLRHETDGRRDG